MLAKFMLIPEQRTGSLEWAEHTANWLDRQYLFSVASSRWFCFYVGVWGVENDAYQLLCFQKSPPAGSEISINRPYFTLPRHCTNSPFHVVSLWALCLLKCWDLAITGPPGSPNAESADFQSSHLQVRLVIQSQQFSPSGFHSHILWVYFPHGSSMWGAWVRRTISFPPFP